jgi:hypothetical protein
MKTDDVQDRRLDWALREISGAEHPPDLTAQVVARWRAGDGAELPRVPELLTGVAPERPHGARWFAAAALLGGALVVAGLAWRARGDATAAGPDPDPVRVFSRADIEALPATTQAVEAHGLDDAGVAALARLRDLRWLEIRYHQAMVLGLGLKTVVPKQAPPCMTARSLVTLSEMPTLQTLRLRGAHGITEAMPRGGTGGGPEAIAAGTLGLLSRLPLLEDLALSHFDTPAYVLRELPRLRMLRRLDLSANYGVDEDAIAAILQCRKLEVVVLRACMTLPGESIARLSELPELRELDVGEIAELSWRSAPRELLGPVAQAWRDLAPATRRAECGVTDVALAGLAPAKHLRVLRMSQSRCTRAGLAALREFPALESLDLFGVSPEPQRLDELADLLPPLGELIACGNFSDAFCRKLRASQPRLARLELPACYAITDQGLADLLAIATLRYLDIRQSRGLTVAAMTSLRAAKQLEFLDLRHIDWVAPEHLRELRAALPGLRTLLANVDGADPVPAGR